MAPPYLTIIRVDANSVEVQWSAIDVSPPKTVDGYWVSMESHDHCRILGNLGMREDGNANENVT